MRINKQNISDSHITTATYVPPKITIQYPPLTEKEQTRNNPGLHRNYLVTHYTGQKKQERKPSKRSLSRPPYGLPQNFHFTKKRLHIFSYNLSWASVFYRLRHSHSGVIEAVCLYCSVTEARSYEGKIIPTHYQRRC